MSTLKRKFPLNVPPGLFVVRVGPRQAVLAWLYSMLNFCHPLWRPVEIFLKRYMYERTRKKCGNNIWLLSPTFFSDFLSTPSFLRTGTVSQKKLWGLFNTIFFAASNEVIETCSQLRWCTFLLNAYLPSLDCYAYTFCICLTTR